MQLTAAGDVAQIHVASDSARGHDAMAPGLRRSDSYRARKRLQRHFGPRAEGARVKGPFIVAPQAQRGILEILREQADTRNIGGPAPPGRCEGQNGHFQDVARLSPVDVHWAGYRIDPREIEPADI